MGGSRGRPVLVRNISPPLASEPQSVQPVARPVVTTPFRLQNVCIIIDSNLVFRTHITFEECKSINEKFATVSLSLIYIYIYIDKEINRLLCYKVVTAVHI